MRPNGDILFRCSVSWPLRPWYILFSLTAIGRLVFWRFLVSNVISHAITCAIMVRNSCVDKHRSAIQCWTPLQIQRGWCCLFLLHDLPCNDDCENNYCAHLSMSAFQSSCFQLHRRKGHKDRATGWCPAIIIRTGFWAWWSTYQTRTSFAGKIALFHALHFWNLEWFQHDYFDLCQNDRHTHLSSMATTSCNTRVPEALCVSRVDPIGRVGSLAETDSKVVSYCSYYCFL